MGRWRPCKRASFIRRLRQLGFEGPYNGTRHQFLIYGTHRLTISSNAEYSVPQLRMIIRQTETILERTITIEEWNALD